MIIINRTYRLLLASLLMSLMSLGYANLPDVTQLRNLFLYKATDTAHRPFTTPAYIAPERTEFIPIHYADIHQLYKVLMNPKLGFISPTGSIVSDVKEQGVWVHDDPTHIRQLKQIIAQRDKPTREILINARIVDVDNTAMKSLGVLFRSQASSTQRDNVDTAVPIATSGIGNFTLPILTFRNNAALQIQLIALEEKGKARLISRPQIITLNNQAAMIESGQEIPYQEKTGDGNTSVAFKKAVLRLKVTPHVMPNHKILIQLIVNQDDVSSLTVNGVPAIRTQKLETQVLVNNRDTFVLGGIFEQRDANQREGVPVLQKLPLFGALFRHHEHKFQQKELLIFITPKIM